MKKNKLILVNIFCLIVIINNSIFASSLFSSKNIFADITEKAGGAVVKVTCFLEENKSEYDPFFEKPLSIENKEEYKSIGTGFIISTDGYILTNKHVINNSKKITITVKNHKKTFNAKIVGTDFNLDLALLKIDDDIKFSTIELGDSNSLRPGDWAIAIGNPYGLNNTVTVGVISALNRSITLNKEEQTRSYQNLIQTDAAINPGNSGGPLLNIDGQVIGISSAINIQGQGISFAVPINLVKKMIPQLKKYGKVVRPWIGIYMQEITATTAHYFGLNKNHGVLITNVIKNSPAQKAGLQPGDIIIKFNQDKAKKAEDIINKIANLKINQNINLTVIRNKKTKNFELKVAERPKEIKYKKMVFRNYFSIILLSSSTKTTFGSSFFTSFSSISP